MNGNRSQTGVGSGFCIGLTGMPGCGKRIVSNHLKDRGFRILELSSFIRTEIEADGRTITIAALKEYGRRMREQGGVGVLAKLALNRALQAGAANTVVDGIRCTEEVTVLRSGLGESFVMLQVIAPRKFRHDAILRRRKFAKTKEDVLALDREAIDLGIVEVMLDSDATIDRGPLACASTEQQLSTLLKRLQGAVRSDHEGERGC